MIMFYCAGLRQIFSRYFLGLIILSILLPFFLTTHVKAEVAGPGWHLADVEPVTPWSTPSLPAFKQLAASVYADKTLAGSEAATGLTPELVELARALQHDPKLIFDYVRNYIDYVPYYGSLKGAMLTCLDSSGNDFDQAALLIALLRESGFTAQFVYGKMTIPGDQLTNWLWVDPGWQAVGRVLPSGGIPVEALYVDGTAKFDRVWVKATIDSVDYLFDPAFKSYQDISGIADIEAAAGYSRAGLLAAAADGANSGSGYTQNLNESAISSKLTEYASNLITTIREQHPNSSVEEIIGGRTIIPANLDQYQTTLPFATEELAVWEEIPADKTAFITISHLGINHTFSVPELSGKRLTMTYSATDCRPELRLDGELAATGNSSSQGSRNDCVISVDHPYAANGGTYIDQTSTYHLESGASYAIISNFGGFTNALIAKRQKELNGAIATGLPDTSEAVLGESLNTMGLGWMQQCRLVDRLLARLADTISVRHHTVGVMAQEQGYYIDVKTAFSSISSKHVEDEAANDLDRLAHFNLSATISSSFEHGILEQMMGSANPGISTIKILQVANSGGHKVFYADQANFSTISSQLTNYSTTTLNDLQNQVNQGRTLVLPADGRLGIGDWQGVGYITKYAEGSSMSLGMIIGGGYYGGYVSTPAEVVPTTVDENASSNITANSTPSTVNTQVNTHSTPVANDPVEMAGGAFIHNHTDLAMGDAAPRGLAFSRSYNSSRNNEDHGLGCGWTHNYDISLTPSSHGEPGLCTRQPVDAAAMIAAMIVNLDLMKNQDDIQGWMITSLINKLAVDQLINNTMNIRLGKQVMEYVRLPDGSYSAPAGITTQLVDNGTTFSLVERFGTTLDFNNQGKISQLTDIHGNTLSFSYDGNRLQSAKDAFGRTLTLHYTTDLLTSVSDSTGRTVSFGYDGGGNLTSFTDPAGKLWQYGYDDNHRVTSLTNPLSITTATNTYDSLGRIKTQAVARQTGSATYNYYFSGYRNIEEDQDGNHTIYFFDDKGRSVGTENALGHKVAQEYDGQDHIVKITDPRMNSSEFIYDGNHNMTRIINAVLNETVNDYDIQNRLIQSTDPLLHSSAFTYNDRHQLTSTTLYPDDTVSITTSAGYYANGLPATRTDARQTTTTLVYDGVGNLASSQTGTQPAITYNYDVIGRLQSLTDQVGTATSFTYDPRNLMQSRTDGLGRQAVFTYYDNGLLHTVTDRNNETTTYTYTPIGKVNTIVYPDTSAISFSYDQLDHLTGMTDAIGTTSYTYDVAGRLTSLTNPHGFAVSYTYDEAGNLIELTYPGNKKVYYSYDELNRLKTVTNWLSQTASYTYDQAGRLTNLNHLNGTLTGYGYDNANRLTDIQNTKSDTTAIATYHFTLDANGNRTGVDQTEPLTPILGSIATNYTYNEKKNRLLTAGPSTFDYDFEGQLADIDGTPHTFDGQHRLISIGGPTVCRYFYNGAGNRLEAIRDGVTTRYIYDASGNLLAEADEHNTITRYYIHGLGLLAMVTPSDKVYCYHFNATGSTIAMTDGSQEVVNKYAYTPFGIITNQQEAVPQPFKYVGQHGVMTEPNGLQYMRARYYDPSVGRFISEDPIGFGGGDVNLYVYVQNNPVLFIDPLGLAYRQERPLDTWGLRNTTAGPFHHDRFLYNDGSDSGYYDDSTVGADNTPEKMINKYQNLGKELDDNILYQAEQNIKNQWDRSVNKTAEKYNLLFHNCQDYADAVMGEYDRIISKSRKNN